MAMRRDIVNAGFMALALAGSVLAFGQDGHESRQDLPPGPRLAMNRQPDSQFAGPILRQIDDPSTGRRWILFGNAAHPEGPGRLLLAGAPGMVRDVPMAGPYQQGNWKVPASSPRPVIHAGDAVIVEEHTAIVDAHLEAVALSSAASGVEFRARLKIGGKVVRALAVDSARATLICGDEDQR
jgi:hypothetical protein